MGGSESTGRKVSFGLDEEDRVRVLRGVRLSDSIVSRMKDSSVPSKDQNSSRSTGTSPPPREGPATRHPEDKAKTEGDAKTPPGADRRQPADTDDDLYRRYETEQAMIQEELVRLAKREREAARERVTSSILREKSYTDQERRRAEHLAKELERKEAELKRLDSFHKEQLASIEKKNLDIYKLTAEQFHTAATNAEFRVKKRSYDPVCMDIQTGILKCYKENQQELLNCSDLAKEYRNCVREAQKMLRLLLKKKKKKERETFRVDILSRRNKSSKIQR
ncbi:MICOS complex subunit MIC25 isoform X2 [Spea bombifrons]|uniref:MICOS complex subunit MIC25 isoform X2 n=1 Tax=Spea bombifrons TaxID=233779 RepID=UPI00234BA918|nr:MICOS complex subunit MIC25 isoform X2 [Spea bombifrons]